jgi:V/A-type H+-transporting ATPase subunit I
MRYDVKKFLFCGLEQERDLFFERAQHAGLIHFIPSTTASSKEVSIEVQNQIHAIKIVLGLPVIAQEEMEGFKENRRIVLEIIALKDQLDKLMEEERMLSLEMSRVAVFGDFSLEDVSALEQDSKRHIQFYCAKFGTFDSTNLPNEALYIGSGHGLDYFCALNKQKLVFPKMVEMTIEKPYGELKERRDQVHLAIAKIESSLKTYARYNHFLHAALVNELNTYHLKEAKGQVSYPVHEAIFMIEGWVAINKITELNPLVKELNIYVQEIAIDPADTPPTSLQNEGAARMGEDLVKIYDTPSNTDKDPSLWVLFFFALFFSMIIGDGGYGLVLLLVALYMRYKHAGKKPKIKGGKERFIDLFTIVGFSCIVWGVLTTSFFGINFAPDSPVRKASLMTWMVEKKMAYHMRQQDKVYRDILAKYPAIEGVKDEKEVLVKAADVSASGQKSYTVFSDLSDTIMLELALFVGVIHVILSMLRYIKRNPQNIGWIIFIIGAYLYIPVFLEAPSFANFIFGVEEKAAAVNGLYLIYFGMGLAIAIALFRNKLLGLLEASTVVQIFGDVLSYLRLYALALSGSLLTATMNELSGTVPFVMGCLILLVGHLVNIVLSIMGGVIHGLRLNFLEWYHYSFEGGGKLFNPLKKLELP